jgi:predicted nucleic acid-binding protein
MVLVDTSVWVEHLRSGAVGLEALLNDGHVVCHPLIAGELACGNLKNRTEILSLLQDLPMATCADDDLLMSALLTGIPLWTKDKRLHEVSLTLLPTH